MPSVPPSFTATVNRRTLLSGLAAGMTIRSIPLRAATKGVKAIGFDGFPVFDPSPVAAAVRAAFPEKGDALAAAWSTKLFGYSWLNTAADRYATFDVLADAALQFAAESLKLTMTQPQRSDLVAVYRQLNVWPDVKPGLKRLRDAGVRLAFVSNLGEDALRANMANAGIADAFEFVLSTDRVQRFKPAPAAYQMAIDAFGLRKDEIGFAAFGGWDALGASWFGYRTAWINRFGVPVEPLEPKPAIVSRGFDGVLALAGLSV